MQEHDWIIEVCEDLQKYAKDHNMRHLQDQLKTALNAAKHDVLLAKVDAAHHSVADCAVLGSTIGICRHQRSCTQDHQTYALSRCQ